MVKESRIEKCFGPGLWSTSPQYHHSHRAAGCMLTRRAVRRVIDAYYQIPRYLEAYNTIGRSYMNSSVGMRAGRLYINCTELLAEYLQPKQPSQLLVRFYQY